MQAIEKISYSNSWLTLVLFFLFVLIYLLKVTDATKLKDIFFAIFNFRNIELDEDSSTSLFSGFNIVIFLFSSIILSIVIANLVFTEAINNISFSNFVYVFFGVLIYLTLKRLLEFVIASVFLMHKSIAPFKNTKLNSFYAISFLMYIFIILYQYANFSYSSLLYFVCVVFIYRFVFIVVKNKKLIFNKLFYFILYICGFEIAPLFILFKLLF